MFVSLISGLQDSKTIGALVPIVEAMFCQTCGVDPEGFKIQPLTRLESTDDDQTIVLTVLAEVGETPYRSAGTALIEQLQAIFSEQRSLHAKSFAIIWGVAGVLGPESTPILSEA